MLLWESAAQFSTGMTDMTFPSHIVYCTREINLNVGYGKKFGHSNGIAKWKPEKSFVQTVLIRCCVKSCLLPH